MPKRDYLYLKIVDGDRQAHYVKTMKMDTTHACVVHMPAAGRLPARKEISLSQSESRALTLANQRRANGFVVDVVPVERMRVEAWLDEARREAREETVRRVA